MEEHDILTCIESALDGFGSNVKNEIFWRMSILHNAGRRQMASDPQILADVIEETFVNKAAEIENSIVHELERRFALSTNKTHSLIEAINDAKKQIAMTDAKLAPQDPEHPIKTQST